MNSLQRLWQEHGQAVWLDYIERDLLIGGGLARLVADDGVRGVTSNPSIFQKAIEGGGAYDEAVTAMAAMDSSVSKFRPTSRVTRKVRSPRRSVCGERWTDRIS
jgi:transaldolase